MGIEEAFRKQTRWRNVCVAVVHRFRDVVHKSAQIYIRVGNGCGRRKQ